MLSLSRKLCYSPTEGDLNIFEKLDIKLKYNITYTGDKTYILHDYKIKYILFSTDIITTTSSYGNSYEGSCIHCGYGNDRHMILQFENDEFGYIQFWNDCLTYDMYENISSIEIANNLDNVIQYCLTDKVRVFYFKFIDSINNIHVKLSKYLIKDLINITVEFTLKSNPIFENYPI
jgi:hypothetical protein